MIKFASIGECMLELRHEDSHTLKLNFAGDTYNVALYLARYRQAINAKINYVTAVGSDPYSNMMLDSWQQEGIDVSLIHSFKNDLPGLYLVKTEPSGERHFYYYRSHSAAKKLFYSPAVKTLIKRLSHFDYLYVSGITLAILDPKSRTLLLKLLKTAHRNGAIIIGDSNYRPILWENKKTAQQWLKQLWQTSDIALVTFDDEQRLHGDKNLSACVKRLKRAGLKEIIIKLGDKGCYVATAETEQLLPPIKVTQVIDTTAAGDSFNAGYIAGRLKNLSPLAAAGIAQQLASIVVQHRGAIIPLTAMPDLFS